MRSLGSFSGGMVLGLLAAAALLPAGSDHPGARRVWAFLAGPEAMAAFERLESRSRDVLGARWCRHRCRLGGGEAPPASARVER